MASIRGIDMSQQLLEGNETTDCQFRYTIQEFHNRSKLFPSSKNRNLPVQGNFLNETFAESDFLKCDGKSYSGQLTNKPPIHNKKRAQSAKSRIEGNWKNDQNRKENFSVQPGSARKKLPSKGDERDIISSDLVPAAGKPMPVFDVGGNAPFPSYDFQEKQNHKYVSQKTKAFSFKNEEKLIEFKLNNDQFQNKNCNSQQGRKIRPSSAKSLRVKSDKIPENIIPSVFGLQSNQQVFGEEQIGSTHTGTCNYKLDNITTCVSGKAKEQRFQNQSTLEPLIAWRSTDLTKEEIGIDPQTCLVFLPSLSTENYMDLPVVPSPHSPTEDLPFKHKIIPKPPVVQKKYDHPAFKKKPVEEWVCHHSRQGYDYSYNYDNSFLEPRTKAVIRKEIEDLENLMKGIGTLDSDCMMVKYQAEIDHFRKTYNETMALVPERLLNSPVPADTFGLRKFYREHDEIMFEIRHQHALCLQELAQLEDDVDIESDRKYFKHKLS